MTRKIADVELQQRDWIEAEPTGFSGFFLVYDAMVEEIDEAIDRTAPALGMTPYQIQTLRSFAGVLEPFADAHVGDLVTNVVANPNWTLVVESAKLVVVACYEWAVKNCCEHVLEHDHEVGPVK